MFSYQKIIFIKTQTLSYKNNFKKGQKVAKLSPNTKCG